MGCGKSRVGKLLASRLKRPLVDLDDAFAREHGGVTAGEFIRQQGEPTFRQAEQQLLSRLATECDFTVISTGGGTVMNPENRRIMRSWGSIVLIDRPLEEILGDIKLDRRPTLRDGGLAEVERIYHERIPVYRDLADIVLKNNQGYHMAVYTLVRLIRERF